MSLIVARPLFNKYLLLFSKHQTKCHNVRPVITVWSMVNAHATLSLRNKSLSTLFGIFQTRL
jgi:lipopolysaccharide/colanic/teichoic acid biosynthesis glycosyltransferase